MSAATRPAGRASRSRRIVCVSRIIPMLMVAILLAALLALATRTVPAEAAAAKAGACGRHDRKGVTVVVDFTKFHHGIKIGCDVTRPRNGLVALQKAGFSYTFVPRQQGFICTIDKEPRKCNGAPASAYWSYWHARPHHKWQYSTLGAESYHPKSGWVEGWAFGDGKPPGISAP
jgi:uncharacterized membrane protein